MWCVGIFVFWYRILDVGYYVVFGVVVIGDDIREECVLVRGYDVMWVWCVLFF